MSYNSHHETKRREKRGQQFRQEGEFASPLKAIHELLYTDDRDKELVTRFNENSGINLGFGKLTEIAKNWKNRSVRVEAAALCETLTAMGYPVTYKQEKKADQRAMRTEEFHGEYAFGLEG